MINSNIHVEVSRFCVHIEDSYTVNDRSCIRYIINDLKNTFSVPILTNRSTYSLASEWIAHNNLYKLHIARSHTKDVDLEWPQKWYYSLAWFLLGLIKL